MVDLIEPSEILVDLIEPSEILVDPIELIELCPIERPKVDLNDSTRLPYFRESLEKIEILNRW